MNPISTLFDTSQPKLHYILKAFLISIFPALFISIILHIFFPELETPSFANEGSALILFFGLVLFSPLIETLLMWPVLSFLSIFVKSTWPAAIISATFWAGLHSLAVLIWGIVIFWSFTVFSISFLEWKKKSKSDAFTVTCCIHMSQNMVPFLVMQLA